MEFVWLIAGLSSIVLASVWRSGKTRRRENARLQRLIDIMEKELSCVSSSDCS